MWFIIVLVASVGATCHNKYGPPSPPNYGPFPPRGPLHSGPSSSSEASSASVASASTSAEGQFSSSSSSSLSQSKSSSKDSGHAASSSSASAASASTYAEGNSGPSSEQEVMFAFEDNEIVPDIIPKAPTHLAYVEYPSGDVVSLGNELTPTGVKDMPKVTWDANPNHYYSLAFVDPDQPSRSEPKQRSFLHWLVGNIKGSQVNQGETLAEFVGSGPGQDTGFHRYSYLIYKQPYLLYFDEPLVTNDSAEGRPNFSITSFAHKYQLGNPIAGNFYMAQYDYYVPILLAQLGL